MSTTREQPSRAARGGAVPEPPTGRQRLRWLGPGFLWMVSAAGSGELLFTPRIGALYGYSLLWALLAAVVLKWFINREVGRHAVCAGVPILEGVGRLPGPGRWALWFILLPQLVVAVATIAGLGSGAATAAQVLLPGGTTLWTVVLVLLATALVAWGRYGVVEKAATALAVGLAVAAVVAAASVLRSPGALARGVVPTLPPGLDLGEVLPWLGFALSGAAGMIWYSYWLTAKGYGAAGRGRAPDGAEAEAEPAPAPASDAGDQERLRGWLRQLTLDNTVAVVGTLIILLGFLVLGTELLRPQGLVPEEDRMARVLAQLLGEVWGRVGFHVMLVGVLVGFWSTVLSDQDGFGRMFANGTRLIAAGRAGPGSRWTDEAFLQRLFVLVLLTALPIGLYLLVGEPVALLQVAGAIEAAHLPVLAALALYVNHARLPEPLRPSAASFWGTVVAALFFATFAVLYVYRLATGQGS